jgi:hypothetical protein
LPRWELGEETTTIYGILSNAFQLARTLLVQDPLTQKLERWKTPLDLINAPPEHAGNGTIYPIHSFVVLVCFKSLI